MGLGAQLGADKRALCVVAETRLYRGLLCTCTGCADNLLLGCCAGLSVPSVPGVYYNSSVTWTNNSRLLYLAVSMRRRSSTALRALLLCLCGLLCIDAAARGVPPLQVPEGLPPRGGWPVLIDLLTVDYPTGLYTSSAASICGLQGKDSDSIDDAQPPAFCVSSTRAACADVSAGYILCERCINIHLRNLSKANQTAVDCSATQRQLPRVICPKPPQIEPACARMLNMTCPTARYPTTRTCSECVTANVTHSHNKSYSGHSACPRNMTDIILMGYCKVNGPAHGGDLPGNVRSFK